MNEEAAAPLVFFDPLLETINFSREIVRIDRICQILEKESWNVFSDLLHTYEMSRLLFKKQAGLNFLCYPSATHNRFAHSLGCWMLGVLALENVRVCPFEDRARCVSLRDWLAPRGKRLLEFLAALLVHDCGHGPFSHVLENNRHLDYNHEKIAAQIIRGQGPFADGIRARKGLLASVNEVLMNNGLDCELIARFVAGGPDSFRDEYREYEAVHDLVEGPVDLDRLDHYYRDSFYMGTKLAQFNIGAFLENILLFPRERKSVRVAEGGVPHILCLLHAKEMIFMGALDTDVVRSYESMLNAAVSAAIEGGGISKDEVPFLTEDELLYGLKTAGVDGVEVPLSRLQARRPYEMVHKYKVGTSETRGEIEDRLSDLLTRAGVPLHDVLAHVPFRNTPRQVDTWLNLYDENGESLLDQVRGFAEFLREEDQERQRTIRFFAKDESTKHRIAGKLREAFR